MASDAGWLPWALAKKTKKGRRRRRQEALQRKGREGGMEPGCGCENYDGDGGDGALAMCHGIGRWTQHRTSGVGEENKTMESASSIGMCVLVPE